jgi:hypothetical protein
LVLLAVAKELYRQRAETVLSISCSDVPNFCDYWPIYVNRRFHQQRLQYTVGLSYTGQHASMPAGPRRQGTRDHPLPSGGTGSGRPFLRSARNCVSRCAGKAQFAQANGFGSGRRGTPFTMSLAEMLNDLPKHCAVGTKRVLTTRRQGEPDP